ncbi:MAG: sulfotransferase [Pseudomonadota bacterium]
MSSSAPENIVCVIGMHRSGTSCLTGSLQASGLILGKFHEENPYNKKGNRENQDIVDLHDQILAANEGSWDVPPELVSWHAAHIEAAKGILERYQEHTFWGFKDPRALLCLEGWKSIVPSIKFVGIFRHPDSVAASLKNRSGMCRDDALRLWYHYNSLLYAEYQRNPFPLISFDWDEPKFHQELGQAMNTLGLRVDETNEHFFSSHLRTHRNQSYEGLPEHILTMYKALQELCK